MRGTFIKTLEDVMESNDKVILILMDIGAFSFKHIKNKFPDRILNFGITEAASMSIAVGLALESWIPVCYTIAPFITSRCFDQIRVGVGYHHANVKIVGIAAGMSYGDLGCTHHAIEDIALLRSVPGMTVISPADSHQTNLATREALNHVGPTYLRLMLDVETIPECVTQKFDIGKGSIIKNGNDISIIATGEVIKEAILASKELEKIGVSTEIVNISTIKPIDKDLIKKIVKDKKFIITIEEHSIIGGLGSAVAETILEFGVNKNLYFERIGINDTFVNKYGTKPELYKLFGLDSKNIYSRIKNLLKKYNYIS